MKAIKIYIVLVFLGIGHVCLAQTPDNPGVVPVKKQLSIRPNSRDYGIVIRNNSFQRIDRQRKQEFINKMMQHRQMKTFKHGAKQTKRMEMMQRRKMMLQQRRAFRR
jgi:hypothetical protein